jgi:hypothetical protein
MYFMLKQGIFSTHLFNWDIQYSYLGIKFRSNRIQFEQYLLEPEFIGWKWRYKESDNE